MLTQQLDFKRSPALLHPGNLKAQKIIAADMQQRAACFWATDCGRGCSIRANYQSTTVHLPPALATGNLDIVTDAMVQRGRAGTDGMAKGVKYIDKVSGTERQATARVIVLAASACETARILLNSKSAQFPERPREFQRQGRASYLMDTVGSSVSGQIPLLESLPPQNEDGASGHAFTRPGGAIRISRRESSVLRAATTSNSAAAGACRIPGRCAVSNVSPAAATAGNSRRMRGATTDRSSASPGRGEMIPNENSYCEIDPVVKDKWGIPVLRFHWKWSDHETRQAAHMQKTFADIIEAMGGRVTGEGARPTAPRRSRPAASSSTRSAARSWARTAKRR